MSAIVKSLSSTAAEEAEWALRVDMAAVFRVSARLGWNEQIGNHNSIMLPQRSPGDAPTFLINPRGYRFEELTASSLIVCDLDGRVLRGTGELRKVDFFIHARIHVQNPADTCVLHTGSDSLDSLAVHISLLGVDFDVTGPPELVEQIKVLAGRYTRATPD